MDTPTLSAFIMPSVYSDEALASARAGLLVELNTDLLIVRLCIDLTEDDIPDASAALEVLKSHNLAGWPLYQVATCAVFLAIKIGEPVLVVSALEAWLAGMETYPRNWQIGVLKAPEVVPFLLNFPQDRLKLPQPARKRLMTRHERDFVQDKPALALRAVTENLSWFRELGVQDSADRVAKWYKLTHVNLELQECYLETKRDLPSIVVSLDDHGQFCGSFFLH
jgi:hypothetical protein